MSWRREASDRTAAALVAATALVVAPASTHPFSGPKLAALAAGTALLALLVPPATSKLPVARWAVGCLAAWGLGLALAASLHEVAVDALLRESLALVLVALFVLNPPGRWTQAALPWVAAVVATLAILQYFSVDPFAWLGFHPAVGGARMRVYATLGNPDFVAAWLGAAGWSLAFGPLRRARAGAAALVVGGLAACGSFATLLAAVAGAVAFALAARRLPRPMTLLAGSLAMALLAVGPMSRSLSSRLEGRARLARLALANIASSPLVGHGPGAFEREYPRWRGDEAGMDPIQDHVHDDWLEHAVEEGVPAALTFALLVLGGLWAAVRAGQGAVAAGLASLAARACVDFPLARVPELVLLAVFLGLAYNRTAVADGVEAS